MATAMPPMKKQSTAIHEPANAATQGESGDPDGRAAPGRDGERVLLQRVIEISETLF